MTIVILVAIALIFGIMLGVSGYFNYKFGKMIIDVEDSLTDSMKILDETYAGVSMVLEMPVALDNPEVKHVLLQIARARDAILVVANTLAEPYGGIEEEGDAEER